MFRKYGPGSSVPAGLYWNSKAWELVTVSEDGECLPPDEGVTYRGAPVLLVLALGPVVGLAFVMFLPLAVPVVALYAAGRAIARRIPRWRRRGPEEGFPARR